MGAFAFGQANLGFESWGTASVPLAGGGSLPTDQPAPESWETLNFVNADLSIAGISGNEATDGSGNVIVPASQETDNPSEGNSYVKLTTFTLTGLAAAGIDDGDYGSFAMQDFSSSTAFESVSVDVKFDISQGDMAMIYLEALNVTSGDTTTIGVTGADIDPGVQNSWETITLPIEWLVDAPVTYYSIIITSSESIFQGSISTASPGSWLAVDNVKFNGGGDDTSSLVEDEIKSVSVYPNPATDVVNFDAEGVNGTVSISSITGQVVANANINNVAKVNVAHLNNGVYIYTIRDNNGGIIKTNKLIIQK